MMNADNFFIEYNNDKINFKLEKSKRKTICIIVKEDGTVVVRAPLRATNAEILKFVETKNKWIYKKTIEIKNNKKIIKFYEGENLNVLGKSYNLNIKYHNKRTTNVEIINDKIIITIPYNIPLEKKEQIIEKAFDKYIFKIAKKEIPIIFENTCNKVSLYPKELKIRNFKRAWGNCSNKQVISINKNLCKFSKSAIEYVCLHEICHLKYMNHSKDFWNMVKEYMPNYKEIEKELKRM